VGVPWPSLREESLTGKTPVRRRILAQPAPPRPYGVDKGHSPIGLWDAPQRPVVPATLR
jgi:hypothetical protein